MPDRRLGKSEEVELFASVGITVSSFEVLIAATLLLAEVQEVGCRGIEPCGVLSIDDKCASGPRLPESVLVSGAVTNEEFRTAAFAGRLVLLSPSSGFD